MSGGEGNNTLDSDRFVVAAGMVGAAGGGFWASLAFERIFSATGTPLDLLALLIAGLLTLLIAWMVYRAGGRAALLCYLVVAGVAATLGPALVF